MPLLLTASGAGTRAGPSRPPYIVEAPRLAGEARARMWDEALRGMPTALDFDAADVTAPYRLGAGADPPGRGRGGDDRPPRRPGRSTAADVRRGARQQNAARLERLARRIEPAVGWDDLVLPPTTVASLRGLADRARHRELVLGEWRMRPGGGRGTGITALFAGDSGTGKTMSAEVIAADLGLDLYVVNLATVVDKYIGETEKNLDRIFAEADNVNGVLLFDEADALFGQRSEVRDSHDRYANIEVAYLLQRMETFDGLAVLVDQPALEHRRRLHPAHRRGRRLPDARRAAPPAAVGAQHRVAAAARRPRPRLLRRAPSSCPAATSARSPSRSPTGPPRATGPSTWATSSRAVAEEYRKLGRLRCEAEFGQYFPLLRP